MTSVDRLVEEMASEAYKSSFTAEPRSWVTAMPSVKQVYLFEAIDMLRVVLSAIESGEVVEIGEEYIKNEKLDRMEWFYKIKLNPDFKAWLNGEGKK